MSREERAPHPESRVDPVGASLLEALSDGASRAILNSTISKSKSVEEIAFENLIPVSTAYRRVHLLLDGGLLRVDRIMISEGGKRYVLLRSTLQAARVEVQQTGIRVTCSSN